jgi:hypothetical protein
LQFADIAGPVVVIWSIPTKRTLADAAGKAGDADNGPIGAALTARSSNYFPRSQATKATGAGMGPWDPLRALQYAEEAAKITPDDPAIKGLVDELRRQVSPR